MSRPSAFKIIWKGLSRRRSRTYATMVCFAIITASLLGSSILLSTAGTGVSMGLDRMGADLAVVPQNYTDPAADDSGGGMSMGGGSKDQLALYVVQPTQEFVDVGQLDVIRSMPSVAQASPQLCLAATGAPFIQVVGFDPDTDFTIQPWLQAGNGDALKSGEALVGSLVGTSDQTTIAVFGQAFSVSQRLDRTDTGMDRMAFVRIDDLRSLINANNSLSAQIAEGEVTGIMVRKQAAIDQEAFVPAIASQVPQYSVVTTSRWTTGLSGQLSGVGSSLALTALIVAIVVVPQVALVSTMVSNERRGEYGMLRALGGTKRFVFGIVFGETILIALIGGVIGIAGTGASFMIIERQLGPAFLGPFLWPSLGIIAWDVIIALLAAMVVGALSAIYPAYVSSRRDPYEVIRTGGGR